MDFQKPNNKKDMKPQKTTKYQNEDVMFSCEDEVTNNNNNDSEDKKQKKAITSGRRGTGSGSGSGSATGSVGCQVEKCTVNLVDAKRYHRRHKVCEFHAKATFVNVSGLTQRFCQQCSRFHELAEFDDAKRSCRRRLAGHNERRRKISESQGEGGSSSRAKLAAANPQCRPADHGVVNGVQLTPAGSYPDTNPTYKHFQIR